MYSSVFVTIRDTMTRNFILCLSSCVSYLNLLSFVVRGNQKLTLNHRFLTFQAFCFLLSCLLYRDTNTSISALESLHQLLLSATDELSVWFISVLPKAQARRVISLLLSFLFLA